MIYKWPMKYRWDNLKELERMAKVYVYGNVQIEKQKIKS